MAEVTSRRRYDTVALVQKLQRERRRGLMLGFCGAGILVALVVVYALQIRGSDIPQVPTDVTPRPTAGQPAVTGFGVPMSPLAVPQPAAPPSPTAKEETIPPSLGGGDAAVNETNAQPTAKAEQASAQLHAAIPHGASLWVDDDAVPRSNPNVTLTPGVHAVRAKIGKRIVTQKLDVASGEAVELRIDTKRKKIAIERRTLAAKHN